MVPMPLPPPLRMGMEIILPLGMPRMVIGQIPTPPHPQIGPMEWVVLVLTLYLHTTSMVWVPPMPLLHWRMDIKEGLTLAYIPLGSMRFQPPSPHKFVTFISLVLRVVTDMWDHLVPLSHPPMATRMWVRPLPPLYKQPGDPRTVSQRQCPPWDSALLQPSREAMLTIFLHTPPPPTHPATPPSTLVAMMTRKTTPLSGCFEVEAATTTMAAVARTSSPCLSFAKALRLS